LALAKKTADGAEPQEGEDGPRAGGGGGGDDEPLGGPAAQRTRKAVDTGRRVAQETAETLTDL
jgi:hypothetical protein